METDINSHSQSAGDFQFSSSASAQQTFSVLASQPNAAAAANCQDQNPKKKRTKLMRIDNPSGVRPKNARKTEPDAPAVTRPCTECGKKFWSWKALFGHMRCHPERQWRGINPPPHFRRAGDVEHPEAAGASTLTLDDHEVASCLLMLANNEATTPFDATTLANTATITAAAINNQAVLESDTVVAIGEDALSPFNYGFECSSCKKVFGSHQALGGHRASHKNVKGCFAITRSDGEDVDHNGAHPDDTNEEGQAKEGGAEKMVMVLGHRCSICLRVFSSGQALGGHKRCHWEKGDDSSSLTQGPIPFVAKEVCGLDLNLPAPVEDDSSSSYSSGLALDLRLAL